MVRYYIFKGRFVKENSTLKTAEFVGILKVDQGKQQELQGE